MTPTDTFTGSLILFPTYSVELEIHKGTTQVDEDDIKYFTIKVKIEYKQPVACWDYGTDTTMLIHCNEYWLHHAFKTLKQAEDYCHKAALRINEAHIN